MSKDSLLKLCRYYHGEKNNPYEGDKALYGIMKECGLKIPRMIQIQFPSIFRII